MLACRRFKGRHTGENILHEYEEIISNFEINKKIFCIISDNATNMIKAFNSVLKSSLNSRLSHFETDETYQLASMLDPRFKLLWAAQENTDELVSLLQKNASSCDASISDGEDSDTSPPNKKHKSDDFFNFLPKSTPKRQRHASERSQLVQRYLDEPTLESSVDPLLF